jgi:GT2 family glycosyltransferase
VVVCSCNGARTIRDCFEGLRKLQYPDFEVIVVNDGSTDTTAAIADEYGFRVISTENRGLSSARNTGLEAATGEIVAYIDDDAYPDPHWLTYLASTFLSTTHVGVGGPNIPPPGDGPIADCIANAPGGPIHVLISDQEAEHIPGCNMAFRKERLQAIGGFDRQFRVAGDDVDICWRMQQPGWTLGFSPAAMVWHHRRNSVRAYWKQQKGYGKAEALLERKWPEKYNAAGHLVWAGRLYGKGLIQSLGWSHGRIYQGTWGGALFQSVHQPAAGVISSLPLMPEWYLVIITLATLSAIGSLWRLLLLDLILLSIAVSASLIQAGLGAARASFTSASRPRVTQLKSFGLTTFLYLLQPLARLCARLHYGLTPWRYSGANGSALPWPRTYAIWNESWESHHKRFRSIEMALRACRANVFRGSDYDRWDLEVQGGIFGATRILMAIEEHGAGRQLLRLRLWPKCSVKSLVLPLLLAAISTGAALQHTWAASVILSMGTMLLTLRTVQECTASTATVLRALHTIVRENEEVDMTWLGMDLVELQFIHRLARSNNGLHRDDTAEDGNGLIKGTLQFGPEKILESKLAKFSS